MMSNTHTNLACRDPEIYKSVFRDFFTVREIDERASSERAQLPTAQATSARMHAMQRTAALATALLGLALIPVAWWLVGDQSSPGFTPEELDYTIRAPEAFERHAQAAGLAGTVVAAICLAALSWLFLRREIDQPGLTRLAWVAAGGVFVGIAGRILTAGSIGANIGGGLVIMVGISMLLVFIFTARRPPPGR